MVDRRKVFDQTIKNDIKRYENFTDQEDHAQLVA